MDIKTEDGRKKIFEETLDIINKKTYFVNGKEKEILDDNYNYSKLFAIENNKKIYGMFYFNSYKIETFGDREIIFNEKTTCDSLRSLAYNDYENIGALNFASGTKPGGGVVSGKNAQEESICRNSSLYNSLNTVDNINSFYNISKFNLYHTDNIIYSPNVCFIRGDNGLLLKYPYYAKILTCAAIDIRKTGYDKYNEVIIDNIMENRINKIIMVAILTGIKNIVLGAFGCGIYKNDPYKIGKMFAKCLKCDEKHEYFQKIIFSIYSPNEFNENLEKFKLGFDENFIS